MPCNAGRKRKLFVEFIAAYARKVIALIEKQRIQKAARAFLRRRFAGALALIDFNKAILYGFGGILFKRGEQALLLAQKVDNLSVGTITERPQQSGDEHLALAVDLYIHNFIGVGFIFKPCAPVGDDLRGEQMLSNLIDRLGKIHARRTHELAYNDALCTIDDKSALLGHEREIPHEHRLLLHLSGFLIYKAHGDTQRRGIVYIPLFTFFHRVFRMIKIDVIVHKFEDKFFGIVGNGRNIRQYFLQILRNKPLIGILLNFDQIRHVEDFVDPGKAHAFPRAHLHLMHHRVHSYTSTAYAA